MADLADLFILGFYLCLRSYEYTKYTAHCRTVQFCPLMYFVFFDGDTLLHPDASIGWFENVTQTVLTLDNQKNAIRGETVSHFRLECPADFPV